MTVQQMFENAYQVIVSEKFGNGEGSCTEAFASEYHEPNK